MLTLSRKLNESVRITTPQGQVIEVVVVEIKGDKVRIGFDAPRNILIHREEVAEAIERNGPISQAERLERKATKLADQARRATEKATQAKAEAMAADPELN